MVGAKRKQIEGLVIRVVAVDVVKLGIRLSAYRAKMVVLA
jgi:hypothetical protein